MLDYAKDINTERSFFGFFDPVKIRQKEEYRRWFRCKFLDEQKLSVDEILKQKLEPVVTEKW